MYSHIRANKSVSVSLRFVISDLDIEAAFVSWSSLCFSVSFLRKT